jgi:hypothetical protein
MEMRGMMMNFLNQDVATIVLVASIIFGAMFLIAVIIAIGMLIRYWFKEF